MAKPARRSTEKQMPRGKSWLLLLACTLIAGCAAESPAPIVDRRMESKQGLQPPVAPALSQQPQKPADTPAGFHDVQKGETLFSIAFQHKLDYRELAQWNGIGDANVLHVGQRLRLTAPEGAPVVTPVAAGSGIVVTPLGGEQPVAPATQLKTEAPAKTEAPSKAEVPAKTETALKTEPKAVKLPYTDKALAQLQNAEGEAAKPEPKPATKLEAKAESKPSDVKPSPPASAEDGVDWTWPTKGKPKVLFTETTKGIDIPGARGQAVTAAAPGKVIHVGSNLRGYGKLVIIQHSSMFLSAYAHNNQVLVKEGERVVKGQKIAEMGDSDTDQVKLHFEIRRFGKPVDPLRYLPDEKAS